MSSSSSFVLIVQSNRRRKSLRKRVTGFTNRIVDSASSLAASSFLFVALWSTHSAFSLLNRDRMTSTTRHQSYTIKRGNVFYANKWIPTRRFHLVQVAGLFISLFYSLFPPRVAPLLFTFLNNNYTNTHKLFNQLVT